MLQDARSAHFPPTEEKVDFSGEVRSMLRRSQQIYCNLKSRQPRAVHLEACKRLCEEKGFGGFVVLDAIPPKL